MSKAEIGPVASRIWKSGKITTPIVRLMALSEGTMAFRTYASPGRMAASNGRESPHGRRARTLRDRLCDLSAGHPPRLHGAARGPEPHAEFAGARGFAGRARRRRGGHDVLRLGRP